MHSLAGPLNTGYAYSSERTGRCSDSDINTLRVWGVWYSAFYFDLALIYTEGLNGAFVARGH